MDRSDSKPPSLQVVLLIGRTSPEMSAQCRRAAATARLHLKESDVEAAVTMASRYRPRALIMTHEQYAVDPFRFDALTREYGAKLVRIDGEDVDGEEVAATLRALVPGSGSYPRIAVAAPETTREATPADRGSKPGPPV